MAMRRENIMIVLLSLIPTVCAGSTARDTASLLETLKGGKIMFERYIDNKTGNPEKAREYAELFFSGEDSSAINPIIAEMADGLAEYYETEKFLFSKAIRYRNISLRIYETLGHKEDAANTNYRLAKLSFNVGQYHNTLKYANEALEYFEGSDRQDIILDCYNLFGIVYYFCKDYDNSNFYFSKCADEARKNGDSLRLTLALNNLAAYENNERTDTAKARSLIREGIHICESMKDTANLFKMYLNLANSYLGTYEPEKAGSVIKQIEGMAGNIQQKGLYYFQLGGYHYYLGEYDHAVSALDSAIHYLSQGEFNQKTLQCLNMLWLSYSSVGDYRNAYESVISYIDLENRLPKADVYLQIFRLQQEKIAQEEEKARIRRTNLFIFCMLIATSIVLLIFMKYRKRMYTVRRQEYELKAKNEIMELKQMQQYQMNRLIETVKDKLTKLNPDVKDRHIREAVSEICNELCSSRDESQWREIKEFVPEFNSESFHRLIKDFPNLTVNERRLCVLLNKNLSTKEISMITRQSVNTITVARTRLRNKFGLTGSHISLQEFLSKYN